MLVLITRPAQQAQSLCAAITRLGGQTLLLPTIAIADVQINRDQLQQLAQQDIAIFISVNAVQKTAGIIKQWPAQCKIAAIGTATAQALCDLNWPVHIVPAEQFNSEALLAMPALQQVANKKIMLFRGEDGRELLANTLRARGARITEIVVYRRVLPVIDQLPNIKNVHVIVCTSSAALQNLCKLFAADKQLLFNKKLLVSSHRMADFAQQLGFTKLLIAANATNEAIVNTLFF
jgi:uroporphyrinogen-III synthase